MKILSNLNDFDNQGRGVFCTIGMFDGLHRGHQHVIQHTVDKAKECGGRSLAITFEPHPARIVAPEHAPAMIYPFSKRRELLSKTNIDFAWIIGFDQEFSKITGLDFLQLLWEKLKPLRLICVGRDFHFGYKRSGNFKLLKEHSKRLNFMLPEITPITHGSAEVSSTVIRNHIREGQFDEVENRLGRPYEICGRVVEGKQIGRTIGFPTANLDVETLVIPPDGVYPVMAQLNGQRFQGIMNIGMRPTQSKENSRRSAEVHLFNFTENIYGQTMEVKPYKQLRREQKFPTLDELVTQIKRDIAQAKTVLSKHTTT